MTQNNPHAPPVEPGHVMSRKKYEELMRQRQK